MRAPSHDIASHLASNGVGTLGATSGWRVNANVEASTPDDVVTVYDTGGQQPVQYDDDLRSPTVQVRTRSHDYDAAYDKQQDVFALLNAIQGVQIDDYHYVGVWLTSDILAPGRDENNRHILTSNYRVERHLS